LKKPQKHPFTSSADALTKTLIGLSEGPIFRGATRTVLTVLLPSASNRPLSSPALIPEENIKASGRIALLAWEIETLTLDPDDALDFLISLPSKPPLEVAFGGSLRFWAETSKLSLELMARQCFIPKVMQDTSDNPNRFRALWEAVISEEDAKRVQLLSNSMPPVCRAIALPQGKRPLPPSALTLDFLHRTLDAFIRRSLSSASILPPRGGRRTASLPEQWMQALSSDTPLIEAPARELAPFSQTMKSWLGQIQPPASDAPFRTCFRIDSPDDDTPDWRISFFLQASDDRSLLVPAQKVWGARSGALTFLKRRFENPQERLLADLGKASRVFPGIEKSLKTARPAGVGMDTEQAYSFLRQTAPLLEQSGFGVLLPPWWQKPDARLNVKLRVKPRGKAQTSTGLMGMDSIVTYDWMIALGDETLSPAEFEKLAELKVPLVQVRGQWVEFRPEEIEDAIAFFRKKHDGAEMALGEALRLGLGEGISEVGLPVTGIEAEGWVGDLFDELKRGAKISEIKPPPAFQGELRPYQLRGLSWLAFLKRFGFGACLADDMGLGKTIEFISLMLHERSGRPRKSRPGPTLLICPMSVAGNWKKEVERFGPSLKVMVHHGAARLSGKAFENEAAKHDLVVSTYALAHRDKTLFSKIHWECVALDEAQNIKNSETKQT